MRAAITTVVPLAAAIISGAQGGTWMSIAGFNVTLVDRGGAYRARAAAMTVLTVTAAIAVALGTLMGDRLVLLLPMTFVLAFGCGIARVAGGAAALIGGPVLCAFVIAAATPAPDVNVALTRASFVVVGGVWATALALLVWPLRPYRPSRTAIAAAYRAFADYTAELAGRTQQGDSHDAWAMRTHSAALRMALEEARQVLAATRKGRLETGRGERLLALLAVLDQMFGRVVALADAVEAIPVTNRSARTRTAIATALGNMVATTNTLAERIVAENISGRVSVTWNGEALRDCASAEMARYGREEAVAHCRHAAALLDQLSELSAKAASNVATLETGALSSSHPALEDLRFDDGRVEARAWLRRVALKNLLGRLRGVFDTDSLALRYAMRIAVVTTAAVALVWRLDTEYGFWLTITLVVILQPHTAATTDKAVQRIVGTVLGGALTAVLGAIFHEQLAILVLAFVSVAACIALLPLNYAAYSIFLTPAFVLLAEASAGDRHLVEVRIANTILGGLLAFVGARVLWPLSESRQLPGYVAKVLRANRDYVRDARVALADREGKADLILRPTRRRMGLALANAEDSLQRFVAEHRGDADHVESVMSLLMYTRRLSVGTGALVLANHSHESSVPPALERFLEVAEKVLEDLAEAMIHHRIPAPLPPFEAEEESNAELTPLLRNLIARSSTYISVLHDSVTRWATGLDDPIHTKGS